MRSRWRVTLLHLAFVVAPLVGAAAAGAQDVPAAGGDDSGKPWATGQPDLSNAATLYRRALAKYREASRRISEAQWMAVYDFAGDPSRTASHEVRQALRKLQPTISLTLNAARRTTSRFNVDYAAIDNQSQHLSDARGLLRLLGYDFLLRIEDGDNRAAMDDLRAMYRMGDHLSQERVLISSLIGSAVIAFADSRLDVALDHAIVDPAEAMLLLRELDRFEGDDPMRYRVAMANEQVLLAERMNRRYLGDGGLERFRIEHAEWFPDNQAAREVLDGLTAEQLQAMIESFSKAAGGMAAAFADDDHARGDAGMDQIKSDLEAGQFAALAPYFIAVDGRGVRESMTHVRVGLDERRELLTCIALGEVDPMSLANAAVWYVKAARQVPNIDPDKRRVIDGYAAKHDAPADFTVATILNRHDVQQLLATLQQASALDRCDWSYANALWPHAFRWLHADVLWCSRLLIADAARLFHAQRYDDAVGRMAAGYRMCADIAADGTIGGSLTAHRMFNDMDALVDAAVDSGMLDEAQIEVLRDGMSELSRADPFHYQPAIARMRLHMQLPMLQWVQGLPKDARAFTQENADQADALLSSLSEDELLALAMTYAYWEPAFDRTRSNDMHAAIVGLDPIFDVQAIRSTADFAPVLTEWAKTGQMELMANIQWPQVAPLEQRVQDARHDYRRCVLRFDRLNQ